MGLQHTDHQTANFSCANDADQRIKAAGLDRIDTANGRMRRVL